MFYRVWHSMLLHLHSMEVVFWFVFVSIRIPGVLLEFLGGVLKVGP